jgi:hypothetical protein
MQLAAASLSVEPAALRATDYRAFRAAQDEVGLPSVLAISLLFAGWHRACEHVAALTCDEVAVEAEVVRTLYGDPSCRRRAHSTRGRVSRKRPEGSKPWAGRGAPRADVASGGADATCSPGGRPELESDAGVNA